VNTVRAIVQTARPRQWVKNLFVAAPLVFAHHLGDARVTIRALGAFLAFCALSSSVYFWNDIVDVDKDRLHPVKCKRPIPAGELPLPLAKGIAGSLAALALASSALLSLTFAICALAYLVNNVAYSLRIKHIVYLDVLSIACGFLLRTLSGALAIDVDASIYLLVCTALLATFFGFGKRLHEVLQVGGGSAKQRAVLAAYRAETLTVAMWVSGVMTLLAYVLYTRAPHTLAFFGTDRMIYTAPIAAFGMIRFVQIMRDSHTRGSPTDEMLRDWQFMASLVAFGIASVAIIYYWH
jgi:4-hydroxybenzoate polyprenyltransferase